MTTHTFTTEELAARDAAIRSAALAEAVKKLRRLSEGVWDDCENILPMDPETGAIDCASERRGVSCPCQDRFEALDDAASKLNALSTTPPGMVCVPVEKELLEYVPGTEIPPVPIGEQSYFIVAVKRSRNDKTYTFPASYLNAYPLDYEDGCRCEGDHCEDGCPTTGWFTCESSAQYELGLYKELLGKGDELVAWAEIPPYRAMLSAGKE